MRRGRPAMLRRSRRLIVATGLVVVAGTGAAHADARHAGTVGVQSTPIRPFVPGALPEGWRIVGRGLDQVRWTSAKQSLFLPKTSTAGAGPAILAGYIGDDEGTPFCPATSTDPGPNASASTGDGSAVIRWDHHWSAVQVAGPAFYTANGAYVIGRDVPTTALRRAARTVRWISDSEPPTIATPPRFRLRATSGLAFGSVPFGATIAMAGPGNRYLQLGQQRSNRAALRVAAFWRAAERAQPRCAGYETIRQRTFVRGHTVYRFLGRDNAVVRRAMAAVQAALRRGSRARFCRIAPSIEGTESDDPRNLCANV